MELHTQRQKKTIGILGGMGPAASVEFYRQLVQMAQSVYGAAQDEDFPPMHLYNLPLHGFDETGFIEPEAVKKQLIAAVKHLAEAGSDFIVIPCNTVHAFYDEMQSAVAIPIISIIDAVVEKAVSKKFDVVGVLSSQSTKRHELYEKRLIQKNIRAVSPSEDEQKIVDQTIYNVMAGKQNHQDKDALKSVIQRFVNGGAKAVILGCTELPLALKQEDITIPLLSSTEILAHAALAYAYNAHH